MPVLLSVVVSLLAGGALSSAGAVPAAPDDAYITGYAAAVLEREFRLSGRSLSAQNGVLTLNAEELWPESTGLRSWRRCPAFGV